MWFNVFLLKYSGFIRSSLVTEASWLRLVPSLLHKHFKGLQVKPHKYRLPMAPSVYLWLPMALLFIDLFGITKWNNIFPLNDSGAFIIAHTLH